MILFAGCGPSRPATAPVHGRVTYQGKPVVEGTIIFHPEKGRQSIGEIAPDGTYKLTTFEPGDGALLGKHRVSIEARRITETILPNGAYGPPKVEWLVPEKYSRLDGSTLTAEVKPGDNTIDFDLPAD
ncbi:MAG: hypothetical protein GX594_01660 [Pirellulaceae bacterium]|nr:hypothetical protein [Pirellulaceae bacterium]